MTTPNLAELHARLGAQFIQVNGCEIVDHYGDASAEYGALRETAGVLDLTFRGRLCLTGPDRVRFLNGQVTNNVKDLQPGSGCYAALVTAKGKMESDLNIYALANELLLDFEPGFSPGVIQRLEKYIIADDVQVVDAAPHYGLLSVQGPAAESVLLNLGLVAAPPREPMAFATVKDPALGETYVMNQPRTGASGYDLFVPMQTLGLAMDKMAAVAKQAGGRPCGWQALELARFEAGIPRFGVDMDETNLAPETGIEERAISVSKGCYIGQEVIARIRTYGQVARALRGLKLADDLSALPAKGDKLFFGGKEAGYITTALRSPAFNANLALGYVRKESNQINTELTLRTAGGESTARIVPLPFQPLRP